MVASGPCGTLEAINTTRRITPPALLLDHKTVGQLLPLEECLAAVTKGFAAYARGETLPSGLIHGGGLGGEFHVKAGGVRTPRAYFSCKINGNFFQNRSTNGMPNNQGLVLLYDAQTGQPLAVMEAAGITRLRTGAATALAARLLARSGPLTALIAGVGNQAAVQLEALILVRQLRKVYVWSRDSTRATAFSASMREKLQLEVEPCEDLGAAARMSDVIVTCTPARHWILGLDMVRPGTFVAAVGADSAEKQELEPALLAHASVVTDLTSQCAEVGDLHHAIAAGLMTLSDVRGELGQVVIGGVSSRKDDREIIIFDSTGAALQDVAAAALVYEKASALGLGTFFPFWG